MYYYFMRYIHIYKTYMYLYCKPGYKNSCLNLGSSTSSPPAAFLRDPEQTLPSDLRAQPLHKAPEGGHDGAALALLFPER